MGDKQEGRMKSFNVENEIVKAYLSEVNYPDGYGHGVGDTKIKPYIRQVVQRSPGNASAYTPNLSEQPKVCNLIPGTTVKVEGQVRMILTNRCYNMRDIGGWPCDDGKHIAYGKIIRGAEIGGLKDTSAYGVKEDIDTLTNEVGINVEMDLRGGSAEYNVSPLGNGVKLYTGKTYGCSGYSGILTKVTTLKTIFGTILTELEKGSTIFLHCKQGADRTGLVCFFIEALCGCSEDSLIKDWEITGFIDYLNTKYISDESDLRSVMKTLYANYGGKRGYDVAGQVFNFFVDKGVMTVAQIERLRDIMVASDVDDNDNDDNFKPFEVKSSDITIFKPYGISTGLGMVNAAKDVNFGYFEISKECYGKTLEVTYKGSGRGVSILTEVPAAISGAKVNVVAGFSKYITKSWLCYVGTDTQKTKEIVIPTCNYDKLYVFVQCHNGKLECTIKVK